MMNVAFLGFGTVGRAVEALLHQKREPLNARGVSVNVSGIASRSRGWIAHRESSVLSCADFDAWLDATTPTVLFESIALDPFTGQPALDYTRRALSRSVSVISANKGPVVHGYRELSQLAARNGCTYRFE